MRPLSAIELLKVWEEGQGGLPYQQAVLLLSEACRDETLEEIRSLSIGRRDSRLLTLREWTFGAELIGLAICPACRERLEFSLGVSDVRVPELKSEVPSLHLQFRDWSIDFRLIDTTDLMQAAQYTDPEEMKRVLIERCAHEVHRLDQRLSARDLPAEAIEALAGQLVAADPQADTQLAFSCSSCGHQWLALFDIGSYFWSEINAWANRILRDVHLLASAYGWREEDILNMNPLRRNLYLELVGV